MDGEFEASEGKLVLKFVQLLLGNVSRGVSKVIDASDILSTSSRDKVAMPGVPLTCFLKMFKILKLRLVPSANSIARSSVFAGVGSAGGGCTNSKSSKSPADAIEATNEATDLAEVSTFVERCA
jgi:hypothetical protein